MRRLLFSAGIVSLVAPAVAFAQTTDTISTVLGLLNIVVGVLIVLSLLLFLAGFIEYLVFLGSDYRVRGLHRMAWGVTVLFVDVLLVAVADIIQAAFFAVVGFVIVVVGFMAISVSASKVAPKSE